MVNSELADQLTGRSGSRRVLEGLFESGVSPSIPIASALSIAQQIENGQALSIYWKEEHTALSGYPMPVTPPRLSPA